MAVSSENQARISLFPLPDQLNPEHIRSATQYIILDHLLRNLVRFNSMGQLEGDLAESWQIDRSFKVFTFQLKNTAKFSDGTSITSYEVAKTIARQLVLKQAIHYDFRQIRSVETPSPSTLIIKLRSTNPNFIVQLMHPEFGVLSPADLKRDPDHYKYSPSSGAYQLKGFSKETCLLERNPFFENFVENAPARVLFENVPLARQVDELASGALDLAIPFGASSLRELREKARTQKIGVTIPHIGFSYWLSLDPRSDLLRDKGTRNRVQAILREFVRGAIPEGEIPWSRAQQLYLPDGLGRPSAEQLDMVWRKIEAKGGRSTPPKSLRVLTYARFPFNAGVRAALEHAGIRVQIQEYADQDGLVAMLGKRRYDAVLVNNDFSSLDLLGNLLVTFNESRPLIYLPAKEGSVRKMLKKGAASPPGEVRNEFFKKISLQVLELGLVAPLAYNRLVFLHRADLDIGAWSQLFPEVSMWKARLNVR